MLARTVKTSLAHTAAWLDVGMALGGQLMDLAAKVWRSL